MIVILESYAAQAARWPRAGRHILAQYDDDGVVVYQAYAPAIGRFAAEHGSFGGEFSFGRMSWIKPSFLWMMYRSGWGTKEGQEVVLAVRLRRAAFDAIVAAAVPTSFPNPRYHSASAWQRAFHAGDVRLQWDPDHDPAGRPVDRRALQLGLRGETLRRYASEWILGIEDVSALVAAQRAHAREPGWPRLVTPREDVYVPGEPETQGYQPSGDSGSPGHVAVGRALARPTFS
jgi:hypothetical protein